MPLLLGKVVAGSEYPHALLLGHACCQHDHKRHGEEHHDQCNATLATTVPTNEWMLSHPSLLSPMSPGQGLDSDPDPVVDHRPDRLRHR